MSKRADVELCGIAREPRRPHAAGIRFRVLREKPDGEVLVEVVIEAAVLRDQHTGLMTVIPHSESLLSLSPGTALELSAALAIAGYDRAKQGTNA